MKRIYQIMVALIALSSTYVAAQSTISATTDDGKKVTLSQDGTWKYAAQVGATQQAGASVYKKPITAKEVLSINKGAASLSYDPTMWKISKQDDPNKTNFVHKNGDIYGLVIAERLEMSPVALKELALNNAKQAATSLTVLQDEKRVVNGVEVAHVMFEPTIGGITFVFDGYYYAGPAGSIQIVVYTGKNLLSEYKDALQGFLNGFEVPSAKK